MRSNDKTVLALIVRVEEVLFVEVTKHHFTSAQFPILDVHMRGLLSCVAQLAFTVSARTYQSTRSNEDSPTHHRPAG